MDNKGTGLLMRKPKLRSFQASTVLGAADTELPETFCLPDERVPDVRDQGNVGACVAFAITNIMQICEWVENHGKKRFSAGYVYGKCREEPGWGMYVDEALDYLIKLGSCPEKDFNVLVENPEMFHLVQYRTDLDEKAEPYKIKAYVHIPAWADKKRRYRELKQALYEYRIPILAVCPSYFGESHAVCIIGWNEKKQTFRVVNSWGTEWKEDGIGDIPYKAVEEGYILLDDKNSEKLMPFKDVPEDEWYYKAIKYMYSAGLMQGTSADTFEPERAMTRAEFAQALYNLCKKLDEREA